jgi:hypothetical protein
MSNEIKHAATCGFGKPGYGAANPLGACTCGAFSDGESSREYVQMQEQKKAMLAKEEQSIRAAERAKLREGAEDRIREILDRVGVMADTVLIAAHIVAAIFDKEG